MRTLLLFFIDIKRVAELVFRSTMYIILRKATKIEGEVSMKGYLRFRCLGINRKLAYGGGGGPS